MYSSLPSVIAEIMLSEYQRLRNRLREGIKEVFMCAVHFPLSQP